jgi:hypothetical protein
MHPVDRSSMLLLGCMSLKVAERDSKFDLEIGSSSGERRDLVIGS